MPFLARIAAWLLPLLLDWAAKQVAAAIDRHQKKVERDAERGRINERNLAKLEACKDEQSCILAARDAYNGVRSGAETAEKP